MNRVAALTVVVNDKSRSADEREIARKVLLDISNHSSDPQEREAALKSFPDQKIQDQQLERALSSKSFSSFRDYGEFCERLDPVTKQLQSDICAPRSIGMLPGPGGKERLESLLARTTSPLVRNCVRDALEVISTFESKGSDAAFMLAFNIFQAERKGIKAPWHEQ